MSTESINQNEEVKKPTLDDVPDVAGIVEEDSEYGGDDRKKRRRRKKIVLNQLETKP